MDVERNRPDALVGVRLHLPLGFEHGDRPIAEVVVERFERAGDDPLRFAPRAALRQNGLERAAEKQRPPQLAVRLMPEQVAMKRAIGGQQVVAQQADDGACLADIAKRRRAAGKLVHPPLEPVAEDRGRLLLVVAIAFDGGEKRVNCRRNLGSLAPLEKLR